MTTLAPEADRSGPLDRLDVDVVESDQQLAHAKALRALKRKISNVVWRHPVYDDERRQ